MNNLSENQKTSCNLKPIYPRNEIFSIFDILDRKSYSAGNKTNEHYNMKPFHKLNVIFVFRTRFSQTQIEINESAIINTK